MSGSGNKKSGARRSDDDSSSEVEDLLRAAEDQLLINLRLNSHPAKSPSPFSPPPSSSSSHLDSDLSRRFDALRSPPNPDRNPNPSKSIAQPHEKGIAADGESSVILGDDLAARFAALKGSSVKAPPPPSAANLGLEKQQIFKDGGSDNDDGDGVSKREVEKLMEWAKDAARLDPSEKSDDDDDENEEDDSDDSEEERRKRREKSKGKPKRWIFF